MGYNNDTELIAYAILITINIPMDMFTTTLNVMGYAATSVVVAKSENTLYVDVYNS